jgi:hypothetical protein
LIEPSSLSQLISMTHKDKQLKMLAKLQVLKFKELSTNQQQLHLLTVCKRNKNKQLLFMIWEEEHSIFLFYKLTKVLSKSKLLTAILHAVVRYFYDNFRMLMVLSKNSYLINSKNNLALMYLKTELLFKD